MKKKIIFLNGHLNTGGVEKSLVDILRTIDTNKYDVELLLFEALGDYIDEIPKEISVRLLDLHNTYGSLKESLQKCIKQQDWKCLWLKILFVLERLFGQKILRLSRRVVFGKQKYDCAIGFRPGICMDMVAYAANSKCKIGWWHHGSFEMSKKQTAEFTKTCARMDYVVSVSNGCKTMLEECIPELKDKLVVISNMLDIHQIQEKAEAYKPFEKNGHILNFVTVGRLSKEKHVENAIYAAKQLKESSFTDFHWYIVGAGAEQENLEKLIKENDVIDFVTLTGNKTNPYPFMKFADILIHTSYVESQCLVVLEAMALGVLCVVTESLGPKEFAVDGENCVLVKQGVDGLVEGICRMKNMLNRRDELLRCENMTANTFSSSNVSRQIEALLENKE